MAGMTQEVITAIVELRKHEYDECRRAERTALSDLKAEADNGDFSPESEARFEQLRAAYRTAQYELHKADELLVEAEIALMRRGSK